MDSAEIIRLPVSIPRIDTPEPETEAPPRVLVWVEAPAACEEPDPDGVWREVA